MKPIRTIVATRTLFDSTSSSRLPRSRAEVPPGRLRPGLALLQVRLGRTQTLLSFHLGGTLAKGVANCQTFIVIPRAAERAQNDEDRLSGRSSQAFSSSGGGIRTHNPSVNSRMLCR